MKEISELYSGGMKRHASLGEEFENRATFYLYIQQNQGFPSITFGRYFGALMRLDKEQNSSSQNTQIGEWVDPSMSIELWKSDWNIKEWVDLYIFLKNWAYELVLEIVELIPE
jgi:hypothetical protein